MARVNNLTNFLTDVASAIKEKTGDSSSIPASQFDSKILAIPAQGSYQTKSISITSNGTMTLLPDTGYDAIDQVSIVTNVPGPDLSDATAVPANISFGKTAYTGNGKITGTLIEPTYIYGTSDYTIQTTRTTATPYNSSSYAYMLVYKKWVITASYSNKNLYFYYDGQLIGSTQRTMQSDWYANVLKATETAIYIATNKQSIYTTNFEVFKADYNTGIVERIGDLNFGSNTASWISNGEDLILGTGTTLSRYNPETNTLKHYTALGINNMQAFSVPGVAWCNYQNPQSSYKTIARYSYNQATDTYTVINKRITEVVGVNYYGDKIFRQGNIYRLLPDLTIGELLKENAYPHQSGSLGQVMICLNDKYYYYSTSKYGLHLYTFDEQNNLFTECTPTIQSNYTLSANNCGDLYYYPKGNNPVVQNYIFQPSQTIIGIEYNGVDLYFSRQTDSFSSNNIMQGSYFYDGSYRRVDGTMPNNGQLNYTPSANSQSIPSGYTSGGTISGDADLIAANIKKDVEIFGVTGTYTSDADATASDISRNKTAYANGQKITGTLPDQFSGDTIIGSQCVYEDGYVRNVVPWDSIYRGGAKVGIADNIVATAIGLTAEKIVSGNTILGIEGSSDFNAKMLTSITDTTADLSKYIVSIPTLDTSNIRNMNSTFYGCSALVEVPLLNTSNVTTMNSTFYGCSSLTSIPLFVTTNVTSMSNIFKNCTSLVNVPVFDTSALINMTNMFSGCTNLSNESLDNILQMCINATSFSGTKTLQTLGLTSTQATTCENLEHYSNFIEAGWTTGY